MNQGNNKSVLNGSVCKGGSLDKRDGIRLDNTVITPTDYRQFCLKAIVSGNLVELYQFEFPLLLNRSKRKTEKSLRDRTDEYKERTAYKGSFSIRRLLHSNFSKYDKFISLTFSDENDFDIKSLHACEKYKKKFLAKLKRNLKADLKYIVVPEFQDKNQRGAVHYHIVCNLPYIEKQEIVDYWSYGFWDIRAIESIDKRASYLAKYISKNSLDKRFSGKKSYVTSNNLVRPKPIYADSAQRVFDSVSGIKPFRTGDFETKYNGKAHFEEYLLADKGGHE